MRKTLALFVLAISLLVTALIIGIQRPATVPTPDPIPTPEPELTTTNTGQASITLGDVIVLDGKLSNELVLANKQGQLSLLLDLHAVQSGQKQRPTMAISLVVDRSGSMAGDKIRQARRAAQSLVSRLSDEDMISIVTYSSDYSLDLPLTQVKGQRGRINRIIDEILDGGGTNLAGGMQAGLETLRTIDSKAIARRLILVSDGNANQGITDPNAIAGFARDARQNGITISTLGVGVDFNEDLMTLVAQSAGGGYYYARDGEAIATAFDAELDGLVNLAARNVEVGLELGPGVSISEVFGYRTEMRRGRIVVPVGDMASGEHRRIMIKLTTDGAANGKIELGGVVLSYTGANGDQEREHRGALSVVVTDDEGKLASTEQKIVLEAFEAAAAARAREEAASTFQNGDKAKAIDGLKKQLIRVQTENKKLASPTLTKHAQEIEATLDTLNAASAASDEGKDLVKSEKLRARQVFAY
jgi:Ca-activated chloride channel homolog